MLERPGELGARPYKEVQCAYNNSIEILWSR